MRNWIYQGCSAGGLTSIIQLAGAAASLSSATGDITVQIQFSGAAMALALASGVLTTQIVLSGAAVAAAAASGTLTGGASVIDHFWLTRPLARRYIAKPVRAWYVAPSQRKYNGRR